MQSIYLFIFWFQGKTLQFYCEFNTQLEEEHSEEEEGPDLFYIVNVAVVDGTSKGKTSYCAETENMDGVRNFLIWVLNL